MIEQAEDFREESETLYRLLEPLDDAEFGKKTLFKHWTLTHVLGHLHLWNWAADSALHDGVAFDRFASRVVDAVVKGSLRAFENEWLAGRHGRALLEEWRAFYLPMSRRIEQADPRQRVKWLGPDMSVRSSISARLMETWAHGQEVHDHLGVQRIDTDRIRNIAQLGVNTFGWTFRNRGMEPPGATPRVALLAPSGAIWEWNGDNATDCIQGSASEFCQVVTQTRNIGDTGLRVSGAVAGQWMAIAQCFAGRPEQPPAIGTRHTSKIS